MPSALCKPELRQTMGEANAKMKLSLRKGEEKRQSSLFSGLDPALGSAAARWVAEATPQLWGVPGAPPMGPGGDPAAARQFSAWHRGAQKSSSVPQKVTPTLTDTRQKPS